MEYANSTLFAVDAAAVVRRLLSLLFNTLYGPLASWYDFVSRVVSGGRWRAWQSVAIAHVVGDRVLEVGCGPGHLARSLASRAGTVVAVDRSSSMCRLTQARLAGIAGAKVVQADGRALPFVPAAFDTAVLTFPAGYVLESVTAIELARVIRPGGRLVVVLGVVGRGLVWRLYGRLADSAASGETLVDHLDSAGFAIRLIETEVAGDRVAVVIGQRAIQAEEQPARWHRSC